MNSSRSTVFLKLRKGVLVLLAALLIVSSLLPLISGLALAQGPLILSTPYPGVTARPGETVEFPLEVLNAGLSSQPVNVSVVSAPEGWQYTLEGHGKAVHQVFAQRGIPQNLTLELELPAELKEGTYQVVVRAAAGKAVANLTLDLKVSTKGTGEGKLQAQYPQLEGPAGATFEFRVNLTNDTAKEQSYSLAAQVPRGWQISFSPAYDSKKIASLSIKAGESQALDVEVIPAQGVKAGEYKIPIAAVSAGGTLQTELVVKITGTYELKLSTPSGRLNASANPGQEREITLDVTNTGSADLNGVRFTSWEPQNWSVRFEPEELDLLAAGETKQVKAYIRPDRRAIAGDYVVSLTASSPEARSSTELRVLVKTSTLWGIVGVAVIVAAIAGVLRLFRLYGRR